MINYDRVSKYIQAPDDFMREREKGKGKELIVSRATIIELSN